MPASPSPRARRRLPLGLILAALLNPPPTLSAQALAPPDRAADLMQAGKGLVERCKAGEAEKYYLDALKEYERRAAARPDDLPTQLGLARCRNSVGELQNWLHRFPEAPAVLERNARALKEIIARHPSDPAPRGELGKCYQYLAISHENADLAEDACAAAGAAVAVFDKLAEEFPRAAEHRVAVVGSLLTYAKSLLMLARHRDAEAAYERALAAARRLAKEAPNDPEHAVQVAMVCNCYAYLVREEGRFPRAVELLREAIAIAERLLKEHPGAPQHWRSLPTMYRNLSMPLNFLGSLDEEAAAKQRAVRLEAKFAELGEAAAPNDAEKVLGSVATNDGPRLMEQGAEADRIYREAERQVRDHPDVPAYRLRLASIRMVQAVQRGTNAEAFGQLRESLALLGPLAAERNSPPKHRRVHAEVHLTCGLLYLSHFQSAEADHHLREALSLLGALADAYPKLPRLRFTVGEAHLRIAMAKATLKMHAGAEAPRSPHASATLRRPPLNPLRR